VTNSKPSCNNVPATSHPRADEAPVRVAGGQYPRRQPGPNHLTKRRSLNRGQDLDEVTGWYADLTARLHKRFPEPEIGQFRLSSARV